MPIFHLWEDFLRNPLLALQLLKEATYEFACLVTDYKIPMNGSQGKKKQNYKWIGAKRSSAINSVYLMGQFWTMLWLQFCKLK